ncbi:hypothetical protein BHE74_00039408 [Ensete ventricosum]|nr:hypothetical protein BHE74_00039408 [Ensete ventricosum]
MVSTPSFSVSSFSSPLSSPAPPPREERCRSNDSLGNQSVPESSSSGVMTGADAKALQALEAMKSHHDFNSTVYLESLGSVRKCFSISSEYILHAPRSGQRPYHPCPGGFDISIDALEARLRFTLHPWSTHPISNVPPNLSDEETNVVEQLKGILSASRAIRNLTEEWLVEVSLSPASRAPPPPSISPAESGSASDVQEIPIEEARGAPEASRKLQRGDYVGLKKKDRHKSPHKADRATRGKGPSDTSDEPPAPMQRPKSVRELCNALVGVDGRDYHTIRMCKLPEQASDAPLDPDLRPLMHGTPVWQSGEASATYI